MEEELSMGRWIINNADDYTQKLIRDDPELLKEVRMCDNTKSKRFERLQQWVEFVDSQDMHEVAKTLLCEITNDPEKYCLSEKWVSWHFVRLMFIIIMERDFLRQNGDKSSEIIIEHDLQDMKYVILLSRADGLLTKDNCCFCLAKAAFPEKDVFSSLDEVPEDYICDWT